MNDTDEAIRVLHVDDDREFVEAAARFIELEVDDVTVEPVTAVSEALDRLAVGDFDCLVADYDLPGMDGLSFLDHVREAAPALPFVLFTGKGSEEIASEALGRGATDYVTKGSDTEQYMVLANRVRAAVRNYRARRDVAATRDRFQTLLDRYRFETLTTHGFEVHLILDETGEITYASHSVQSVLGRTPEEMIGEGLFDHVHPGDGERARAEFADVLDDAGYTAATEFRVQHADGDWVALEVTGHNRLDDPGIEGVVVVGRDVTRRRRHRRRAERLEERLGDVEALARRDLEAAVAEARERLEAAQEDCDSPHLGALARTHERLAGHVDELRSLTRGVPTADDDPEDGGRR